MIVIKDLDTVKEMTVKQFENFQNRPPQPDLLRKKRNAPRGVFNARDDYWKKIRTTLSPTFSSAKMKLVCGLVVFHSVCMRRRGYGTCLVCSVCLCVCLLPL